MGVTGASGFPCCTKESVDIVDTQIDLSQHQFQLVQTEDEAELEDELLELEPQHKERLDLDAGLELEMDREDNAVPPLEWCLAPTLKREANLDSSSETYSTHPEEERYKIEPIHPSMEGAMQQDACQWSVRSNSSCLHPPEENQASATHYSVRVQTSKHLFWADKLIQASEQNLWQEISGQPGKESTDKTASHLDQESGPKDTLCSEKPLQNPSPQPELLDTSSRQPPATHLSPSSVLPALSLEDLVTFATSLAIATSSKADLPNLGHMMKASHEKVMEPSPAPPANKEPGQEKLSEMLARPPGKLEEAGEPENVCERRDKNFLQPYIDCSKPGLHRAVIEGQVRFLQPSAMSSPLAGDRKDSVPRTKKGSPLLLKIHFKLPSPPTPAK